MNGALLRRTLAAQRLRLVAVVAALALWGYLLVVSYATFGVQVEALLRSRQFANVFAIASRLTGGNVFSLGGSVALGLIHPIALGLVLVFAAGFTTNAIAGERQRGTLEVLLSRPVGRRELYATLLVAALLFVALGEAAVIAGAAVGAQANGLGAGLDAGRLAWAWLNGVALFAAISAFGLSASASFDRLGPAVGLTLGLAIASYAAEYLALLWPDAAGLGPWSIFHYFQPARILDGRGDPADLLVLLGLFVASVAWALVVFPRRDIAAPS